MTVDKQDEDHSSTDENANLIPAEEFDVTNKDASIPKEKLPTVNKILITDDGKDDSNKALNYAVSLSKYSGAELLILRILKDIGHLEDVSVQGTGEVSMSKGMKREVKGEIIDEMENKIRKCKEAGCENKISYKFRVGNVTDEIVNEVKEGDYDLMVLRSTHTDSRIRSLFSDSLKIITNISIPVLIVQ